MKRRKSGGTPKSHAPKTAQLAVRKPVPADVVPAMMEQTARNEIKTVTEIGSRRWKSGQTK